MVGSEHAGIRALLDKALGGDGAAREELFGWYRGRLRQMVACCMDDRLCARLDPSDVVQEALAIAAQRLSEYLRERPVSFYPWLRQITWNRLVDLHRAHILADKRSVTREGPAGVSSASVMRLADKFLGGTSPMKRLLREELRGRVRSVLAALASNDREILLLRHVEDLSTSECAEVLGISEIAVKQRHVRAVRRLRSLLDPGLSEGL